MSLFIKLVKNEVSKIIITMGFLISTPAIMAENLGSVSPHKMPSSMSQSNDAVIATTTKKTQPLWTKNQQKQAELEKQYKEDIAKNPENKKNYAYLAGLYLASNKSAKAIKAYQEAIMHDPENPKLFAAMSIAFLHQSKFAMAKEMADQALKIDPSLKSVSKINEYIIAKKQAIDKASKVPAGGKIPDMSRFDKSGQGHGAVMPTASGKKPVDKLHNPN